ncbi:MAG: FAD-dependent monooxygenase, partial [Vicinamibacterales bacterium]
MAKTSLNAGTSRRTVSPPTAAPVIICGAGPVGLAMAIELARHGVRSTVFERHPGTAMHPKARYLNTRTLEIVRQWDPAAHAELVALDWPRRQADSAGHRRMSDPEAHGARAREWAGSISPESSVLTSQDMFEPVFLRAARRTGLVDVRFSHEVLDLDLRDDGVRVSWVERTTMRRASDTAAYVVAADGASSQMRARLGIAMAGVTAIGHYVNVYFQADLSPWLGDRPRPMYWVATPTHQGVFQPVDGQRRWLCQLPYDGSPEALARYDVAACTRWIRAALRAADVVPDILSIGHWTMNATVAERFSVGDVFLVGDAAHTMPPTGGLGVNTGIQGAHNLAWKLALVLKGQAHASLLATYESERRPVALENTRRSLANARALLSALGAAASTSDCAEPFAPAVSAARPRSDGNVLGPVLGDRYTSTAVTPDGTAPAADDQPLEHVPRGRAGHRAP